MKTYPYPTPDGITQLVEESEYNRLKWELEESKAKHGADVSELNARLTKQQADMLDTIVQLRADLTRWQAMKKLIRQIYEETEGYADGAPDATAHDKLCNEISSQLEPYLK